MIVCSVCGERTWNYEPGVRVCVNGHQSSDDGPLLERAAAEDKPKFWRWRFALIGAWLLTLLVIIAAELLPILVK